MVPRGFQLLASVSKADEDPIVQALVPQEGIKAPNKAVLIRLARTRYPPD